jgi:hypothetical protein
MTGTHDTSQIQQVAKFFYLKIYSTRNVYLCRLAQDYNAVEPNDLQT